MPVLIKMAVAAQMPSLPFFLLLLTVGIVLLGILAYFVLERRRAPTSDTPSHVAQMGYGRERHQRELVLWQGILRRLEIQAKYQNPISERLQNEIDEAKAKIAEAEQGIKKA
jgi:hypothetical protein